MSHPSEYTVRLSLEADFDPQLPGRVLDRFAALGTLPQRFAAYAQTQELVRIEVEWIAHEADTPRRLAQRLMSIPTVRGVDLVFRGALARAA